MYPNMAEENVEFQDEEVRDIDVSKFGDGLLRMLTKFNNEMKNSNERCNIGISRDVAVLRLPLSSSYILRTLQDLVTNECSPKNEEDTDCFSSLNLGDGEKLCIASRSIIQYILCLGASHSHSIFQQVSGETHKWMNSVFGFTDWEIYYTDNQLDCVGCLFKMLLSYKYPTFLNEGFEALKTSEPVIYIPSLSSCRIVSTHICHMYGLPLRYVNELPDEIDDDNELGKIIEKDLEDGKMPIMFIMEVGTQVAAKSVSLEIIQTLCKRYNIWLHLFGDLLAALPIFSTQVVSDEHIVASSVNLKLGSWLNVPALPYVMLYRKPSPSSENPVADSSDIKTSTSLSLPLWMCLQALGRDNIVSRLKQKFVSCSQLISKLKAYACVEILSQIPADEDVVQFFANEGENPVQLIDLFRKLATCVVFRFVFEDANMWHPSYGDKLNSWLSQVLCREFPEIRITTSVVEGSGVVLQYTPFKDAPLVHQLTWNVFFECLHQQLEILESTVAQRKVLYGLVNDSASLKLVELRDWAGLGGVRYVPQAWDQVLTDQAKNELNRLNLQIVEQLRNTDSAFSAGEGDDGLLCIRFGMIGSDSDVTDLIHLVLNVGKQEEDSWNFIDTMADIVKKGIQEATLDLQKEAEDKLWQEGILRHVPVFGSLYNWWSPVSKENEVVKGRSLDLNAGVISSTENIYRYHAQRPSTSLDNGIPVKLNQLNERVPLTKSTSDEISDSTSGDSD